MSNASVPAERLEALRKELANRSTILSWGKPGREACQWAIEKIDALIAEAREEGKPQTRAERKATDALMSDDEYELRKFIAFAHQDGKCHIYGDDGELQCSDMLRHGRTIDFRREPIPALLEVIYTTRLREYAESQKTPPASAGTGSLAELYALADEYDQRPDSPTRNGNTAGRIRNVADRLKAAGTEGPGLPVGYMWKSSPGKAWEDTHFSVTLPEFSTATWFLGAVSNGYCTAVVPIYARVEGEKK